VCVDRAIVSQGLHGGGVHTHDHVSQAYLQMQAEKEGGLSAEKKPSQQGSDYDTVSKTVPSTSTDAHGCEHKETSLTIREGGCEVAEKAAHRDSMFRAWVFFFALSLHSVFDGLSVGVTKESSEFISTTVAVVSHKVFDVRRHPPCRTPPHTHTRPPPVTLTHHTRILPPLRELH